MTFLDILAIATIVISFVALAVSFWAAKTAAEAKRKMIDVALTDHRTRVELMKAYKDLKIDHREVRLISKSLHAALEAKQTKEARDISYQRTLDFLDGLHPQKSRRIFEDLAKSASIASK